MRKSTLDIGPNTPPEEVEEIRKASIQKWREDAASLLACGQYEQARNNIEKIYGLLFGDERADTSLHALAADVYSHCRDFPTALNYINRSIRLEPDNAMHLVIKADVLIRQGQVGQARQILNQVLDKAERQNDDRAKGEAAALYAYSLYYNNPIDRNRAIQYAEEAAALKASREFAQDIDRQIAQDKENEQQNEQRELEQKRRRKEAAENILRQYARKQAACEERTRRMEEKKKWAAKGFVIAQVLFVCLILAEIEILYFCSAHIITVNPTVCAVFSLAFFFVSAAFIKYMYTLRVSIETLQMQLKFGPHILPPLEGINIELGIVGVPHILGILGSTKNISGASLIIVYPLFVGTLFFSGYVARGAADRLK